MTNTAKLLSLFLLVTFFACQSDDNPSSNNDIVGKWNLTANYSDDLKIETVGLGETYTFNYTVEGHDFDAQIELRDDGTFTSGGRYSQTVTTTYAGEELSQSYNYYSLFGEGTYSFDGQTLSLTNGTETVNVEVVNVSASKLKLKWLYEDIQTSGGATSTTSATYYYELEK